MQVSKNTCLRNGISFAKGGDMKKIIALFIFGMTIFYSCKTAEQKAKKEERKISKRDYSISKDNSYNDIFLDSADVIKYIAQNTISDSISRRIISFYNTRNYEYAWFSSDGISEQAMGFSSLLNFSNDTTSKQKKLEKEMDNLMADSNLQVRKNIKSIRNTELLLTERLIEYSLTNFEKGYVKRKELERFIPFKKENPLELADSLLNKKHKDDKYFSDINKSYKLLEDQLRRYVDIAKSGGWPSIGKVNLREFKQNHSSSQVISMKRVLIATGDIQLKDTSDLYDSNLRNGIKSFQLRFGFTPDGKLDDKLIKEMNVSVINRIKQILINMNRMRWLPQEPEGRLIEVNIPAFTLQVHNGKDAIFSMPVVVGKEGHNTTLFSDMMTTIVFSPYWNVPSSIVKNEIIPGMDADPNYLDVHNMEITGQQGNLPVVRQKPGPENSLGKVKFLFPNSFNIYLHDTPAKELFNKDIRAFSHGCIRVYDPEKLSNYLLKNNDDWTPEKIKKAMNSGNEQYVKLKKPVPVFITYYTAWVDGDGVLNFRDDIYGHDKEVAQKMFTR